ncbi:hypothetical protein COV82_03065 [Candidatus Peregrinibacteria bacterium CG11_big_fil_rev_8_21_14_0_20_46_8]|nr:MAG: hypothetical protein COV82_03065 [Candidatus Peregrinibacteria bacterium CG11_big_fil_rev_8_21_14_0_20_46_8]
MSKKSKQKELLLLEPKTLAVIIVISVLTLVVSFFGEQGVRFMTSVLTPLPQHAPFDGTTYPVPTVPNWVKLSAEERDFDFASLSKDKLMPIPAYNANRLAIPVSNLKWNDPNDDAIRNEKITYSVPYLGNYKLDGLERTGSHAAVDIKTLTGTPVVAIANGVVTKVRHGNSGFGNHIVVQHNNVPTLTDKNVTTTLHSSYSHMSFISVEERQVVVKGQVIGYVGDSGAATTPHLHFQIDVDDAPFKPYWPFSNSDMNAAGYSFFEAINKGLKQENGVRYTINPMLYVQKYFGGQVLVAANTDTVTPAAADPYDKLSFKVQTADDGKVTEGSNVKIVIQAFTEEGLLLSNPDFTDSITLSLLNEDQGTLNIRSLDAEDLKSGIVNMIFVSNVRQGTNKVVLRFRNSEFSSNTIEVKKKAPEISKILILPERTEMQVGEKIPVVLRLLDKDLKQISQVPVSTELLLGLSNPIGILDTFTVPAFRFVNGEAQVNFTASLPGATTVVVVDSVQQFESQEIRVLSPPEPDPEPVEPRNNKGSASVLTPPETDPVEPANPTDAADETLAPEPEIAPELVPEENTDSAPDAPQPEETPPAPVAPQIETVFTDVDVNNKYFAALKALKADNLVAGYGDGSFRPTNTVTRAEAITFILRVVDKELRENVPNIFPDVESSAWYVRFIATAFDLGFVKGHPDGTFKPDSNVTIAEFFTMLFEAAEADVDPQITIALTGQYDPNEWYAPYIQEAMKKGVLGVFEGVTSPDRLVTRGEIAQVIYTLRQQEGSRL